MGFNTENSGRCSGLGGALQLHANGRGCGAGDAYLLGVPFLLQSWSARLVFVGWVSGSGLQTNMQECEYLTHKLIIKWLIPRCVSYSYLPWDFSFHTFLYQMLVVCLFF